MELSRRQIIAYVVVAAVVVAVGVRYVVAPRVAGPSGEPIVLSSAAPYQGSPASQAASSGGATASGSASPAADALVYVCGAVHSPGVVRLPQGARVADALELAGGATAKAELAAVNLAARVADGQQIVVPEKGPSGVAQAASSGGGAVGAIVGGSAGAGAGLPGALVNLNTASIEELDGLQGVGPSTAQKIIDYRTENGPFTSIEDVKNVSGIGDAKFAAMKDSITV
jgi:competence protein ComEA